MAAPRVPIPSLPDKPTADPTDLLIVQDGSITKSMTMQHLVDGTGISAHIADTTDAHAASAVSALSNGTGQDALTVQGQLNQIKTALDAVGSSTTAADLAAHIADTTDAHDASAVSVIPASGITSAQVQAALQEIVARAVNTTAPLTGGGDLTANRTLAITPFAGSAPGAVPASPGSTTLYLRADGQWSTPAGSGGGLSQATADTLYVNVLGDTMTGTLAVPNVNGPPAAGLSLQAQGGLVTVGTPTKTGAGVQNGIYMETLDEFDFGPVIDLITGGVGKGGEISAGSTAFIMQTLGAAMDLMLKGANSVQLFSNGVLRVTLSTTLLTSTLPVVLPADPTTALQAATKQYVDAKGPVRRTVKADSTTAYAPVVGDENQMVTLSNAAAITVTLPSNATQAFPVGAEVDFLWLGVGQPTFAAGSGATVQATPGPKLRAQYSAATAKKISTNGWVVIGDLST